MEKNINIYTIKLEADMYQQEHDCNRSNALDIVAVKHGYENYKHARTHNSRLRIIARWCDNKGRSGQEYLDISLSKHPQEICNGRELYQNDRLYSFRYDTNNCLVHSSTFSDQFAARQYVCYAARIFLFMDITNLKPSNNSNFGFPNRDENGNIKNFKGFDHVKRWFDTRTGKYYFTVEPYPQNGVPEETITEIKELNRVYLVLVEKTGMHHIKRDPTHSTLFYIGGQDKNELERLIKLLKKFWRIISENNWGRKYGISVDLSTNAVDVYLSPEALPIEKILENMIKKRICEDIQLILEQTYYRNGIYNPIRKLLKLFFEVDVSQSNKETSQPQFYLKQITPLCGYLVRIRENLAAITSTEDFENYNSLLIQAEQSIDKAHFTMSISSIPRKNYL